jgi:hypothetical protein
MLFKFTKIICMIIILSSFNLLYSQIFWNEVNSGVSVSLRCVSNIDATIAWSCGDSGTVIRTTDGGYNWENESIIGIPTDVTLVNIFGIDINHALTAGYSGTNTFVYYTNSGGIIWEQVFTQSNGFIDGIWMVSPQQGLMVGDPVGGRWSLWKTTNGGMNWDSTDLYLPQSGSEAGWNNSLWADSNQIWFGTNNNRIYYSSNYGSNWEVQSTGGEQNSCMVTFRLPDKHYGLTGGNTLLLSSNGGLNWQNIAAPGTDIFNGAAFTNAYMSIGWYVRSGNTIYRSSFPYNNWVADYTAPSGTYNHMSPARTFFEYGPGVIFAVRSNGGISRSNSFVEGVKILSNKIPALFKLYQNYPNPFNPSTKIKLEIPLLKNNKAGEIRGALIQIKIYNSLGQKIETVLDQITKPGVYEASWDGSKYPSGIYYYQVVIKDPSIINSAIEHQETRKMVLVK